MICANNHAYIWYHMIRLSPAIMVLWNMAAAIKMSDDSLTFLCINCQVNFHANAGWCRAEGHDVTWRRPPLVAACILKPLHDCYSSLRMMLHPCWWGLASYHNLFDVSFWIRSNEPPPWAHKRKILAKWMLPRHQIPKPSSGAVYHQILGDFLMKVCMWATLKVLRRGMSSVKKASELVGSCILKRKEKADQPI